MKSEVLAALGIVAALGLAACSQQEKMGGMHGMHMHGEHAASASAPAAAHADHASSPISAASAGTELDLENTKCPVTLDPTEGSPLVVVYKGKVYHLCCGNCPDEFNRDPAKFAAEVASNPAKYGIKPGVIK